MMLISLILQFLVYFVTWVLHSDELFFYIKIDKLSFFATNICIFHPFFQGPYAQDHDSEEIRPNAVCRHCQGNQWGQPSFARENDGRAWGIFHQIWSVSDPRKAENNHLQEFIQESVSFKELFVPFETLNARTICGEKISKWFLFCYTVSFKEAKIVSTTLFSFTSWLPDQQI